VEGDDTCEWDLLVLGSHEMTVDVRWRVSRADDVCVLHLSCLTRSDLDITLFHSAFTIPSDPDLDSNRGPPRLKKKNPDPDSSTEWPSSFARLPGLNESHSYSAQPIDPQPSPIFPRIESAYAHRRL